MYWPRKSFLMLFGCPRQNINHSSEDFKVIYIKCSMFYVYCTSRTVYNFIVFSGSVEVFILHSLSLSIFFSSTYQVVHGPMYHHNNVHSFSRLFMSCRLMCCGAWGTQVQFRKNFNNSCMMMMMMMMIWL